MNHSEARRVLGVSSSAPKVEITRAYRVLAMKWHPDRDGGRTEKFKELQEALRVLEKPEDYQEPPKAKERPTESEWEAPPDYKRDRPPVDDLDEDFIGSMAGAHKQTKHRDNKTVTVVQLTIQEAFHGCYKDVHVSNQNSLSGHPVSVRIVAGCRDGALVATFKNNIEKHDVFIKILSTYRIQQDEQDLINRGNIYNDLRIPVVTMLLGGLIKATMIDGGEVNISVPAGLSANTQLRIRGRGYWTEKGSSYRGDCILRAVPIIQQLKDIPVPEREALRRAL